MIMHRYFGTIHKEKGSGRVLRLDPFFRGGLFFVFFCFAFYFTILILYTTGFNPRTNTDIIILMFPKNNNTNIFLFSIHIHHSFKLAFFEICKIIRGNFKRIDFGYLVYIMPYGFIILS